MLIKSPNKMPSPPRGGLSSHKTLPVTLINAKNINGKVGKAKKGKVVVVNAWKHEW